MMQQSLRAETKQNVGGFLHWHTQNLQTQVSMELWVRLHELVHFHHTFLRQLSRTQQTLKVKRKNNSYKVF
jgi:hypothetical protein